MSEQQQVSRFATNQHYDAEECSEDAACDANCEERQLKSQYCEDGPETQVLTARKLKLSLNNASLGRMRYVPPDSSKSNYIGQIRFAQSFDTSAGRSQLGNASNATE